MFGFAGCGDKDSTPVDVGGLRVGGINFVEVDGESKLPLEYMWTGEGREKLEAVRLPRYWIAEKPITKAVFAWHLVSSVILAMEARDCARA